MWIQKLNCQKPDMLTCLNKNILGPLFIIFFLSGCTTLYNPATGKREFIAISTPSEVVMGKDIHNRLMHESTEITDVAKKDRVNQIGKKIAEASDRKDLIYHFYVLKNKELNAFTTPGGNIYINEGLLDKLTKDDQVAYVIGHEVGHTAARHIVKRFQAQLGVNVATNLVFDVIDMQGSRALIAKMGTNALSGLIFNAYSRKDEYEADTLGVKYMTRAGYDPYSSIDALQILIDEAKNQMKLPAVLNTHPYPEDRMKMIKDLLKGVPQNSLKNEGK